MDHFLEIIRERWQFRDHCTRARVAGDYNFTTTKSVASVCRASFELIYSTHDARVVQRGHPRDGSIRRQESVSVDSRHRRRSCRLARNPGYFFLLIPNVDLQLSVLRLQPLAESSQIRSRNVSEERTVLRSEAMATRVETTMIATKTSEQTVHVVTIHSGTSRRR